MKAIVTGSSGFIGSNLANQLLSFGWKVLGLDNLSDYYSIDFKQNRTLKTKSHENFEFTNHDIFANKVLNEIVSNFKPDFIFHLAAQAGVRIPLKENYKYVESNLVGFSNILQAALMNDIPNFLYASSSSVYGDDAQIPFIESERNLNPNSFYGATKLSNEILANSVIKGTKTRARGMRFFTVYGPAGRPDMAYFRIINSLINGTPFHLYGNGSIERDFTFVDDCVEMIIRLSEELSSREPGFSDLVNIGGGHPVSMQKLIEIASLQLNRELKVLEEEGNPKDVAKTMADSTYLMKLIGDKPKCKLEDGLAKTIEWARNEVTPEQLASWVASSK